MAVGQNQWYHFGVGSPLILVYSSGDWDVQWGHGLVTHGHMAIWPEMPTHYVAEVPGPILSLIPAAVSADLRLHVTQDGFSLPDPKCVPHFEATSRKTFTRPAAQRDFGLGLGFVAGKKG